MNTRNTDLCYKCHTKYDLSIKKRDRHGSPVYQCRPCRRADYHRTHPDGNRGHYKLTPRPSVVAQPPKPSCYKCKATEDLIEKDGWRKRLVCRTCNRASKTEQIRHNPFQPHYACGEDWLQKARESQERILRKYA